MQYPTSSFFSSGHTLFLHPSPKGQALCWSHILILPPYKKILYESLHDCYTSSQNGYWRYYCSQRHRNHSGQSWHDANILVGVVTTPIMGVVMDVVLMACYASNSSWLASSTTMQLGCFAIFTCTPAPTTK